MKSLIYIIEARDRRRISDIKDAFTTSIYGSTLLARNVRLLKKDFSRVQLILLVHEALENELRLDLQEFLRDGGLNLQIVTQLCDAVVPSRPESFDSRMTDKSIDAVLFQRGIGALERLDSKKRTYHCSSVLDGVSKHEDRLQLIDSALKIRHTFQDSENVCYLVQRQESCAALERDGYCVSVSEVAEHAFAEIDKSIANQLLSYLHSKAALRSMDGPVSRFLLRKFSRCLSRPLAKLGVHPNAATLAAAAFALAAIFLFTFDSRYALVTGGFIWFIGGILDEVDGELARLQGKESEFGAWLDLTFDRILDGLVLVGLAWPVVARYPEPHLLIVMAIAITIVATSSYIGLLYDGWMKNVLGRTVYFRIGRDTRNLIIFLCAISGFRIEAIWIAAALSLLEIFRRLVVCYKVESTISSKREGLLE